MEVEVEVAAAMAAVVVEEVAVAGEVVTMAGPTGLIQVLVVAVAVVVAGDAAERPRDQRASSICTVNMSGERDEIDEQRSAVFARLHPRPDT